VPRLCVVAEMLFDFTGAKISSEFYEAVMESKARVTYGQAQEMIDGTTLPDFEHVRETVLRCADLARLLMAKRFREGSLDLEIPETQLQIDGSGRPVDVIRSERLFAHRLIEELMLAANVAVAEFLSGRNVPALYRVHEPPNEISLKLLERYLTSFGSRTKLEGGRLQKRLTRALEEFAGKPEAQVLHILTLRSMSQAKYSPTNLGHFGLGFENYAHFTSPIRRYPDLVIHRLLKNQIMPQSSYRLMSTDDLSTAGAWLSACEQRSVKAERNLMSIKKARFMQPLVGREFEGFVSSVARFGAFVLLREYDIDGLVRTDDLGDGRWEYDEERLQLVARSSGRAIGLGDSMKIVVAAADPSTGQVTFVPSESLGKSAGAQNAKPRHESERRGSRHDRRGPERGRRENDRTQGTPHASSRDKRGAPARGGASAGGGRGTSARHERQERQATAAHPPQERMSFRDRFKKKKHREEPTPRDEAKAGRHRHRDESPREGDARQAPKGAAAAGRFDRGAIQSSARSRKLQFADRTKLGLNKRDETPHEGSRSAGRNPPESPRKDAAKRGSPENDRGGVRKARVPQRGGKSSPGKVSRRKAQRQRRD
jgi:ribonuclease R